MDANTDAENEYDDLNRLTKVTDKKYSPYKITQCTYYEDGLRKSMTDPEGNLTEYTYDKAKRLDTTRQNSVQVADYDYNALGLRTVLRRGNGLPTYYNYDLTTRWLTGVYHMKSNPAVISSFRYRHDKVGNRTKMTLADGDYVDYAYDEIYQLTSEIRSGSTPYALSWSYDEVGNRLTQDKNGTMTDYIYNDANQLTQEVTGAVTTTYEYDANGNMTQKSDGTNTWTWTYDYENRQVTYNDPDNSKDTNYAYDANSKRIAKTNIQTLASEHYLYDGANVIMDLDDAGSVVATYITPFLDQNLLTTKDFNTYYFLQDGLGSVRNIVDQQQMVSNEYDYYAFGEILSEIENVSNRYKFTAREWDAESQNYYYRARCYSPKVGRFGGREPREYNEGINLYFYVRNNPVNWVDPSGSTGEKPCEGGKKDCYCCCVEELDITRILPIKDEIRFGHYFQLEMKLKYVEWNKEFADCELEWWEKVEGVAVSSCYAKKGMKQGRWFDVFENMPELFLWPDEERNIKCPGKETYKEYDEPQLKIRSDRTAKRTLSFALKVKSAPSCPCDKKSIAVFAHQVLEITAGEPKHPGKFDLGGLSDWPPGIME